MFDNPSLSLGDRMFVCTRRTMIVSPITDIGWRRRERIFTQVDISRSLSLSLSLAFIFLLGRNWQVVPVKYFKYLKLVTRYIWIGSGRTWCLLHTEPLLGASSSVAGPPTVDWLWECSRTHHLLAYHLQISLGLQLRWTEQRRSLSTKAAFPFPTAQFVKVSAGPFLCREAQERHKEGTSRTHQLASHQVAQSPPPQREQLTTSHTLQKPTSRKKLASTHTTSRHSETHWTYTNGEIAAHACQDWEIKRSQCAIALQWGTRETQGRHIQNTPISWTSTATKSSASARTTHNATHTLQKPNDARN